MTTTQLQRSHEETDSSQRLLLALSHTAQAVLRARTPGEVHRIIGDEVKALGHDAAILRSSDDGATLEISYLSYEPAQLAQVEQVMGFSLLGYRITPGPNSFTRKVMDEGLAEFVGGYRQHIAEAVPAGLRPLAGQFAAQLGIEQAIIAPLTFESQAHGLLIITGSGLNQAYVPAVNALANQTAIALSNVHLYQEVLTWAARLEQRVEERTAELAISEARYRRLFDASRDGLYIVDTQGRCLDANPAACHLLGYSREDLLALDVYRLDARMQALPEQEQRQLLEEIKAEARQGQSGIEMVLVGKKGLQIPVEVTITPLVYQAQEAMLVAVRDISERKQAGAELRRSQEQALRSHRFLLAISQAAQAVQRASTSEEVYQTIGDEVAKLGYQAIVFTLAEDRSYATITHTTLDLGLLRAAERLVGLTTRTVRVRLANDDFLQRVIVGGESIYSESMADRIASGVPRLGRSLIGRLPGMLGIERGIYAPLRVRGETCGLLVVAGSNLMEADTPAVAVFANQAGIALENAELMAQVSASRARLSQLARQVVSAQEEERRRLSRALHDEAGQALTALKISLELLAQDRTPESGPQRKRLIDAVNLTDATLEEIRQLAQDLRPTALDAIGLNPTLEGYCRDFASRTQLPISYRGQELPLLPDAVNITLYRFLQEGLTNVVRHARAKGVCVALLADAEAISLSVEDDGRGFDPTAIPSASAVSPAMGLLGMRERLELLEGRLEVDSEPGTGTRLTAYVPLPDPHLEVASSGG